MARDSDRSRLADEPAAGIAVRDVIELKASYGLAHGTGIVVVLDDWKAADPSTLIGTPVRVRRPDGAESTATIDEAKDHGATISLYIKDWTRSDVPAGSMVMLEERQEGAPSATDEAIRGSARPVRRSGIRT